MVSVGGAPKWRVMKGKNDNLCFSQFPFVSLYSQLIVLCNIFHLFLYYFRLFYPFLAARCCSVNVTLALSSSRNIAEACKRIECKFYYVIRLIWAVWIFTSVDFLIYFWAIWMYRIGARTTVNRTWCEIKRVADKHVAHNATNRTWLLHFIFLSRSFE